MFGVILAFLLPVVLVVTLQAVGEHRSRLAPLLYVSYLLRVVLQSFMRDLPLFSYGAGGDYSHYEMDAKMINVIWQYEGIHFVTGTEIPQLGPTSLPPNLFALIYYINGEPTRLGCTAVIAMMACLTALNTYRLALEFGAEQKQAFRAAAFLLLSPSFVMYTSDLFKDGIVLFCVNVAFGSALRLSRRFSILHGVLGALAILSLWFVRYYLIFVAVGPIFMGFVGLRSRAVWRPLVMILLLTAAGVAIVAKTNILDSASDTANAAYEQSEASKKDNAATGSGVYIDDGGSPFGRLWLKLLYTLFAPFPWQFGSIAMQIGKLETFAWYYIMYLAVRSARELWRRDRPTLLLLLAFITPTTLIYACTVTNVGLVLRERMSIVMVTTMLAALSRSYGRKLLSRDAGSRSLPQRALPNAASA
jgi:hypothetical protein